MSEVKSSSLPLSISSSSSSESDAEYWENHLKNWRQSGLKQSEYCRKHNLNYNSFRRWKERAGNNSSSSGKSIRLV